MRRSKKKGAATPADPLAVGSTPPVVEDDEQEYEVVIPKNMKPGDKMRIPVPSTIPGKVEKVVITVPADAEPGSTISVTLSRQSTGATLDAAYVAEAAAVGQENAAVRLEPASVIGEDDEQEYEVVIPKNMKLQTPPVIATPGPTEDSGSAKEQPGTPTKAGPGGRLLRASREKLGAASKSAAKTMSSGWTQLRHLANVSASFTNPFASVSDTSHETGPFRKRLDELFPNAWNHEEAAVVIKHTLAPWGFDATNTIALVAQCRDEIAKPFVAAIDHNWNGSFNVSSLAGSVICGKTGFTAAIHHAPQDDDGVERYVIFCGPHIAIDADGVVGNVMRRGRKGMSSACGALIAFCTELNSGRVDVEDKPLDIEYCALKRRLLKGLPYGQPPDLTELTRVCQRASVEDVRAILDAIVTRGACEYAVVSGTLVHGPGYSHYFSPASIEVTTRDGKCEDVTLALEAAEREEYRGEMLRYLAARAQHANLLCRECDQPMGEDTSSARASPSTSDSEGDVDARPPPHQPARKPVKAAAKKRMCSIQ